MNNPIANIYWRTIKRGARDFLKVPLNLRPDIRTIAEQEVQNGTITSIEYEDWIGEPYMED